MKRLILISLIFSFLISLSGCSSFIYLSGKNIIGKGNFPAEWKQQIIDYKSGLTRDEALKIIENAFIAENSAFTYGLRKVEEDGMILNYSLKISDNTYLYPSANKTIYHIENFAVRLYFNDIKRIYIDSGTDFHFVMVKNYILQQYDADFGNNFGFRIRPGTDKIPLIASLIYLCTDIKD
jgi:hypothetical protein